MAKQTVQVKVTKTKMSKSKTSKNYKKAYRGQGR